MLKFENVSKSFGNILAIDDVSFEIASGEFVFITGASGAGKSTVLNLTLRKYPPTKGKILFDGKDITKLGRGEISHLRQNIGTVFQDFKVLPERTIRENVEVALAVKGVSPKEWKTRVDQVLETVGLTNRANLFPSQLSGGEIQRTSLARALVIGPEMILADEPTGNLDWETAEAIMQLFEKVHQTGKTIVIATHHLGMVEKMKKRVIKMRLGKIENDSGSHKEKASKTK